MSESVEEDKSGVSEDDDHSLMSSATTTSNKSSVSSSRSTSRKRSRNSAVRKLTPFTLRWAFGYNRTVPILNLTTRTRTHYRSLLSFSAAHVVSIYDYRSKEMNLLQGHQNTVTTLAVDSSGKWLVSADQGDDNVVIVWDSDTCVPVRTIFNPHPKCGTRLVGISEDAKYLLTVSNEKEQSVMFWKWTLGKDEPDAHQRLQPVTDKVKHVTFSSDVTEQFVLTSENNVYFGMWDGEKLSFHVPDVPRKVGQLTQSAYLSRTHFVATATTHGSVLIWSDINVYRSFLMGIPIGNVKNLIRVIKIEKEAIPVLTSTGNVVVTGNTLGHVRFYDQNMKILYWCNDLQLDSISAIRFNLRPCARAEPVCTVDSRTRTMFVHTNAEFVDYSEEYELKCAKSVPSDATLNREAFVVPDFVVSTEGGRLAVINFLNGRKRQCILYKCPAVVTAIDVHFEKQHLCVGNSMGQVATYNYYNKELQVVYNVNPTANDAINSLKFAPSGYFLACGTVNGLLWILHPVLLTPLISIPFHHSYSPISFLCFSHDWRFLGHKDDSMCVHLYQYKCPPEPSFTFFGKIRSHYKPIQDLMFIPSSENPKEPRYISIGEDRMLVEYDLLKSEEESLLIKCSTRIEQSSIPLCMSPYPDEDYPGFILVVNDDFKFKLINDQTIKCRRTILGPRFGSPIVMIKMLQPITSTTTRHMLFSCNKQIGLQMLPLDGNPFKSVGMIGHSVKIEQMCVSADNKYLFTIGQNGYTVLKWAINTRTVDVMSRIGGEGLRPYHYLIEGGESGFLFQEMQDFFYYAQILHQGENSDSEHTISNKVPSCELPDLMRAIGFYPSDYEVENMIEEVAYLKHNDVNKEDVRITFDDFVKLYINHHPACGIPIPKLRSAFEQFAEDTDSDECITVPRDNLLEMLQEKGEPMTQDQVLKYFTTLIPKDEMAATGRGGRDDEDGEEDADGLWSFIPREISFVAFVKDILGISTSSMTGEAVEKLEMEDLNTELI